MNKKIIIAIIVGLIGISLLVNGYYNGKQESVEVPIKENEVQNTTKNSTPNTTTTTTTQTANNCKQLQTTTTTKKTTKKTVKTTKKKTTKKAYTKVATASRYTYIEYARSYSGFDDTQMNCLIRLWDYESGWNPNNVNTESGACGIPQAKPCNKIKKYRGNNSWKSQIEWGVDYIKVHKNYGTPCKALEMFKKRSPHWY